MNNTNMPIIINNNANNHDRKQSISDILTINVPKSNLGPIPNGNPPPPPPNADILNQGNQLISRVSAQINGDQLQQQMNGNTVTPRGTQILGNSIVLNPNPLNNQIFQTPSTGTNGRTSKSDMTGESNNSVTVNITTPPQNMGNTNSANNSAMNTQNNSPNGNFANVPRFSGSGITSQLSSGSSYEGQNGSNFGSFNGSNISSSLLYNGVSNFPTLSNGGISGIPGLVAPGTMQNKSGIPGLVAPGTMQNNHQILVQAPSAQPNYNNGRDHRGVARTIRF